MAIIGPKPWVNPFGKMPIFLTFELLRFYNLERRLSVLKNRKRHFPGLYCPKKKKKKKWPFLDENYGLTLWKKFKFFEFLNFLFL